MAVMDPPRAIGFADRVDPEQDLDGLGPVSAIRRRIEKPHVELDVPAVVFGDVRAGGGKLVEGRDRGLHGAAPKNIGTASRLSHRPVASVGLLVSAMLQHHSLPALVRQDDDPCGLECPANLIPC